MNGNKKKKVSPAAPHTLLWAVRGLAFISAVAMLSTGEVDPIFLILFAALFVLGVYLERFAVLVKILGRIQPVFALLVFFVAVADFVLVSRSFLLAVAHFLLGMMGVRLLALSTTRECLGSVLLASLMMLSATTLAVEWTFFAVLLLFLPAIIWTLVLHNIVLENDWALQSEKEDQEAVQQLAGLTEKSIFWRKLAGPIRRSAGLAFFVTVSCAALVFVVFPRLNFQSFRGRFLEPVHRSGFSNQVDLKKSGRIFEDTSVAMRVAIPPEERRYWTGYMRGGVLDEFTGQTWKRTQASQKRVHLGEDLKIHSPWATWLSGPSMTQHVYLEASESAVLFAAQMPVSFRVSRPFLEMTPAGSFYRPFGDSWRIHYEVQSRVSKPLKKEGRPTAILSRGEQEILKPQEEARERLLHNPLPRVDVLADSLVAETKEPLEKALQLSQFLSNNFGYTLDLGAGDVYDPIGRFLFETKEGHCEYFASSLCLMLRSQGIPARLVTGFYSEEWNERGHYVVIRNNNAHSWVEAFIEPYGWVEMDPSPLVWRDPPLQSEWIKRLLDFKDNLNLKWNQYVLSYDWQKQVRIFENVNKRSKKVTFNLDKLRQKFVENFDWYINRFLGRAERSTGFKPDVEWVSQIILIFSIGLLIGGIWLLLKKESPSSVWFYPRLLRILEKKGGPKKSSQTLKEFIAQNEGKWAPNNKEVRFLSDHYYRRRFDPSIKPAKKEDQEIRKILQIIK